MTYYTRANLEMIIHGESEGQYAKEPGDAIENFISVVRVYLEPFNYSTGDILKGFEQAMRHGTGEFGNMFHTDFEKIIENASKKIPEAIFRLRCSGSEFYDVYLREFCNGKITISIGPFEE
ncbi:hypothetical protein ACIGHN_27720 [Acidovorax sp. NPDC077693]|uniref:hypothetical protein n=1 Tax=unclassified Acidovorax TaxID=2684926 RepID=UPI0037C6954A